MSRLQGVPGVRYAPCCNGAAVWLAALVSLVGPTDLSCQDSDAPPAGTRVRVVASRTLPTSVTGTLVDWRGDSLFLDADGGPRLGFPLTSIHRLERSRGRRSKIVTGTLVGLATGLAATGSFLAAFCSDSDTVCESDEVFRAFAIITPPPTVLGALIGLAVRVERWEAVPLPRIALGGGDEIRYAFGVRWSF